MESKTFYSPAREYYLVMNTGTIAIGEDGKMKRVGERAIQFKNPANGKFGSYTARDPEEIAFLEERSKVVNDVLTEEQFIEASTPVEQKVGEARRELQEQNKLLADLREREAALKAEVEELRAAVKPATASKK